MAPVSLLCRKRLSLLGLRSIAFLRLGVQKQGIFRCNAFVVEENKSGQEFWKNIGWEMINRNFKVMQTPTENI
jgi:hypothetical protein